MKCLKAVNTLRIQRNFPPLLQDKLIAAQNPSLPWQLKRSLPFPALSAWMQATSILSDLEGFCYRILFSFMNSVKTIMWVLGGWIENCLVKTQFLLAGPSSLHFENYLGNIRVVFEDKSLPRHAEFARPCSVGFEVGKKLLFGNNK